MKYIQRIALCFVWIFALAACASGTPYRNADSLAKVDVYYASPYDRWTGITGEILLQPGPVPPKLAMHGSYTVAGAEFTIPETVTFSFLSYDRANLYFEDRQITIAFDGQRVVESEPEYAAVVPHNPPFYDPERLTVTVPFATFEAISESAEVGVSVGPSSFTLTDEQRAPMRELVRQTRQPELDK